MSQSRTLRINAVGAFLGVSHQRAEQMFHEGKFPEPQRVDDIGPIWKPATIERWAEREWWDTRRWRKRPSQHRAGRDGG